MKCPVCENECGEASICDQCGFNEVGTCFLNKEDAEHWMRTVVLPLKKQYQEKRKQNNIHNYASYYEFKNSSKDMVYDIGGSYQYSYVRVSGSFAQYLMTLTSAYAPINAKRLILPIEVEKISESVFCKMQQIEEIILPPNLKEIGFTAFSGCTKLKYIVIPSSVDKIDGGAFQQTGLEAIFSESLAKPSKWLRGWNSGCNAKVYWKNEWHYNENGDPVPNKKRR
jgi:hypothetical protein